MKRRILPIFALTIVTVAIALLAPMRRVVGDDMAWSIQDGEWVWLLPDRIRRADVVLVDDPLDPGRQVLRRVIAGPGMKVRFEGGGLRVNGKRIRQQEMGEAAPHRVIKEVIWSKPPARANAFLPRILLDAVKWDSGDAVEIPDGHWYVMADDRDAAMDSRWWGPIAEENIHGVVRARWGQKDTWRPAFELLLPEE